MFFFFRAIDVNFMSWREKEVEKGGPEEINIEIVEL